MSPSVVWYLSNNVEIREDWEWDLPVNVSATETNESTVTLGFRPVSPANEESSSDVGEIPFPTLSQREEEAADEVVATPIFSEDYEEEMASSSTSSFSISNSAPSVDCSTKSYQEMDSTSCESYATPSQVQKRWLGVDILLAKCFASDIFQLLSYGLQTTRILYRADQSRECLSRNKEISPIPVPWQAGLEVDTTTEKEGLSFGLICFLPRWRLGRIEKFVKTELEEHEWKVEWVSLQFEGRMKGLLLSWEINQDQVLELMDEEYRDPFERKPEQVGGKFDRFISSFTS